MVTKFGMSDTIGNVGYQENEYSKSYSDQTNKVLLLYLNTNLPSFCVAACIQSHGTNKFVNIFSLCSDRFLTTITMTIFWYINFFFFCGGGADDRWRDQVNDWYSHSQNEVNNRRAPHIYWKVAPLNWHTSPLPRLKGLPLVCFLDWFDFFSLLYIFCGGELRNDGPTQINKLRVFRLAVVVFYFNNFGKPQLLPNKKACLMRWSRKRRSTWGRLKQFWVRDPIHPNQHSKPTSRLRMRWVKRRRRKQKKKRKTSRKKPPIHHPKHNKRRNLRMTRKNQRSLNNDPFSPRRAGAGLKTQQSQKPS